jgi:ribonuclease HI
MALPGTSATNPVWKIVWKLKIPAKVKKKYWRALHGILPLKSIMVNQHVGTSGECPICRNGPEDVMHLLFSCPIGQEVWRNLGLDKTIQESTLVDRSGSAVLEHLLRRQDNSIGGSSNLGMKEVVCVTSWYLWWLRRRRSRQEPVPPIFKCKMYILAIASNSAKAASCLNVSSSGVQWKKPIPRQLKLNMDASFHADSRSGSTGAVVRDFQGNFVAAACSFLPHVASPVMAGAIGMREGLMLIERMGSHNVIAESDSMEVINACKGDQRWWSESAAILAGCVDLVSNIGTVSFGHCLREVNEVEHELAAFSFSTKSSCSWDAEAPNFIVSYLINDVTIR